MYDNPAITVEHDDNDYPYVLFKHNINDLYWSIELWENRLTWMTGPGFRRAYDHVFISPVQSRCSIYISEEEGYRLWAHLHQDPEGFLAYLVLMG